MTGAGQWAGLNDRQRLYLRAVFDADQAAEADIKARRARWEAVPPAAVWRLVTFSIRLPRKLVGYSTIQDSLRTAGEHDSGAGATLAALERRGLLAVVHDTVQVPVIGDVPRVAIRLTTKGRAAARAGTGQPAPARTPAGLVARWHLVALARLYAAGERGLTTEYTPDRADRAPSTNLLAGLERRSEHFLEYVREPRPADALPSSRARLGAAGRRHYELHAACYRDLYGDVVDDVALPTPAPRLNAHTSLAHHTAKPPRHLLRGTDLRLLIALIGAEREHRCHLREIVTGDYERLRLPVPETVRQMPDGLLHQQVKDIAGSLRAIDRLRSHHGGPHVDVIDAPNSHGYLHEKPTIPLVVLTDAGRAHYRDHLDEYRTIYPELGYPPAPDIDRVGGGS